MQLTIKESKKRIEILIEGEKYEIDSLVSKLNTKKFCSNTLNPSLPCVRVCAYPTPPLIGIRAKRELVPLIL